jgi:hypothetical protein
LLEENTQRPNSHPTDAARVFQRLHIEREITVLETGECVLDASAKLGRERLELANGTARKSDLK